MIKNYLAFYDFETSSKNKYKTQPLQLSCVMIDFPRLKVLEDSVFDTLIRPVSDEEAEKEGLDTVQDEALEVNKITRESLVDAPVLPEVWKEFQTYLKGYNLKGVKGNQWDAPVAAGFNIINFDNPIVIRLCEKYGPKLDEYGGWSIFHPFHTMDLMQIAVSVFHSRKLNKGGYFPSFSMDTLRDFHGICPDHAHNARKDILDGAFLLVKYLKLLRDIGNQRYFRKYEDEYQSINFEDCFRTENEIIKGLMS